MGNEPYIVMELMNAGNLQSLLQTNAKLTDVDLLTMFDQIKNSHIEKTGLQTLQED